MAYNHDYYMYNTGYGYERPESQQSSTSDFHQTPRPVVAPLLTSSPPPLEELSAGTRNLALPLQRLSIHKQFLSSREYLNYCERKRQDIGKDNKPVWPEHVEAAFQNALVWIPPMGRKKRPQNGKPHGRNELISEWIFQETGEVRCRKQVSSHIQVLGFLLNKSPEWKALTKVDDSADEEYKEAMQCSDSIADIVQHARELYAQNERLVEGEVWQDPLLAHASVARLRFDMYISRRQTIQEALHTYSRVHKERADLNKIPLEDFLSWRQSFPALGPLIQSSPSRDYDLILLKCNLDLLSELPPSDSQLGLTLGLDYRRGPGHVPYAMSDMTSFSCTTTFYHRGGTVLEKHYPHCNITESGVIKPPFEAAWWADRFTRLTQRANSANHAPNDAAAAVAKTFPQHFLHDLRVMQVIEGSSPAGSSSSQAPTTKRIAVLLWTFRQVPDKRSAVTKWYRLIPPPIRNTTNSLISPSQEMGPPLNLSSRAEHAYPAVTRSNTFDYGNLTTVQSAYPAMMYPDPIPSQNMFYGNTSPTSTEYPAYGSASEINMFDDAMYQDQVDQEGNLTSFQHPFYNPVDFGVHQDQMPLDEPLPVEDTEIDFGLQ